jgi:hypothetical protein
MQPTATARPADAVKPAELDSHLPDPDTLNLVSRVDDSTPAVGPPEQLGKHRVDEVLLGVRTPPLDTCAVLLDTCAASYLAPDEVDLLAAALSTPASTATDRHRVVSFGEGASATEIGLVLDALPPGSMLTDFSCDATACLVFTCPSR